MLVSDVLISITRNEGLRSLLLLHQYIAEGHDLNAPVNLHKETLCIFAASRNDIVCLQILIDQGVDLNAVDKHGRTALMQAAQHGYNECIRMLLDAGADRNIRDYGESEFAAIDFARTCNQAETMVILSS